MASLRNLAIALPGSVATAASPPACAATPPRQPTLALLAHSMNRHSGALPRPGWGGARPRCCGDAASP